MSNSLGFRTAPPLPVAKTSAAAITASVAKTISGWIIRVPLFLLCWGEFLHVQLALKGEHAHPHTHEERFLWQRNIYFNVALCYLALESVLPVFQWLAPPWPVVRWGLVVDFFVAWGIALSMALPLELNAASGDLPDLPRGHMVLFYVSMGGILALKVIEFVREVRRVS